MKQCADCGEFHANAGWTRIRRSQKHRTAQWIAMRLTIPRCASCYHVLPVYDSKGNQMPPERQNWYPVGSIPIDVSVRLE